MERFNRQSEDCKTKDFSSQARLQVTELQYKSVLRTLRQVQEKRAEFLKKLHGKENPSQTLNKINNESLIEASSEWKDYLRYFSPVEKAGTTDVTGHLVRPTPRHISPMQYPGRKICHPVPATLRRPHASSPADSTDSVCLPLKKRSYTPTLEDVGPPSKAKKLGVIEYQEENMTDEDAEVAEIMYEASSANTIFPFTRELRARKVSPAKADDENGDVFGAKPDVATTYCHSPKPPWILDKASDIRAAEDRRYKELGSTFTQISPIVISASPENDGKDLATLKDIVRNASKVSQSDISETDAGSESDCIMLDDIEPENENAVDPERSNTEAYDDTPSPEAKESGQPQRSMEELRRFVLTKEISADHSRRDRGAMTEKEEFVEILEDFLEENQDLQPHLKEEVLEMLMNTRISAAKERETIWYTAELYTGESDNEFGIDGDERSADGAVSEEESENKQATDPPFDADDEASPELYQPIKFSKVEMDSTGQAVYDEIAAFFGYDGYIDYLSCELPTEEEDDADQESFCEIDNDIVALE